MGLKAEGEEGEPRWLNKLNDRESKVEEATREVKEEVAMLLPRYLSDAEAANMAGNAGLSEVNHAVTFRLLCSPSSASLCLCLGPKNALLWSSTPLHR